MEPIPDVPGGGEMSGRTTEAARKAAHKGILLVGVIAAWLILALVVLPRLGFPT